ncbi:hypothetical protein B0A48_02122 [Cryoendolithus antarcticus]|uniref:SET domain-containing protein n=1 Tax=Cryoendolithus antarcticus TaxID=1507870 RepID=A0A1V8TMQ0_9PEZI|nr:hypothetical protein B0A48_02122 [Cryoendolithus antarcticus]
MANNRQGSVIDLCEDSDEGKQSPKEPRKKPSSTPVPAKRSTGSSLKQTSSNTKDHDIDLTGDSDGKPQSSQKRDLTDKVRHPGPKRQDVKAGINGTSNARPPKAGSTRALLAAASDVISISDDEPSTTKTAEKLPREALKVKAKAPAPAGIESTKKRSRHEDVDARSSSPLAKRTRHIGSDVRIVAESPQQAVDSARKSTVEDTRKRFPDGDARSSGFRTARDIANRKAQDEIEKSRRARYALADQLPGARGGDESSLRRPTKALGAQATAEEGHARKIAESPNAGPGTPSIPSPVKKKLSRATAEPNAELSTSTPAVKIKTPPPRTDTPPNASARLAPSPRKRKAHSAAGDGRPKSPPANDNAREHGQRKSTDGLQRELQTEDDRGSKQEGVKTGIMGTLKAGFNALMGPPKAKAASAHDTGPSSDAVKNPQTDAERPATSARSPRRTTRDLLRPQPDTDRSFHVTSPLPGTSSDTNTTPAPSVTTTTPIETATSRSTPAPAVGGRPVMIQLTPLQQVEQTLEKYAAEMRTDTSYATKAMLKRVRLSGLHTSKERLEKPENVANSIFASLPAMPLIAVSASSKTPADSVRVNVETCIGKASVKSHYLVKPTICDTSEIMDVPGYTHYVSLRDNLLAPNVLHMNVWPYFGDEYVKEDTFGQLYHVDTADRERKLRRLLQAQRAEDYANSALEDLGITWSDVLHFLLDRNGFSTAGLHDSMKRAVSKAATSRSEDFPSTTGDGDKWVYVLSYATSKSKPDVLGTAALLCDCFQSSFKIPLWHLARRSRVVSEAFEAHVRQPLPVLDRTCRVCFHFNCSVHGEYREEETDDAEPGMEEDPAVATDLVHPEKVNRRKRMSFLPTPDSDKELSLPFRPPVKKRTAWDPNIFAKLEERGPFYPCHHPGKTCEASRCTCAQHHIHCEKSCGCASDCARKYHGCACKTVAKGLVCFEDSRCACFQLGRECDPNLCGACGVSSVLDSETNHDMKIDGICRNSDIQHAKAKLVLLGDSGVHGMGLYAGEAIRADEFIGEYVGEVITTNEGERRGAVYEHQFLSYLFSLNKTQEVDATYYGNEMRFMNHRPKNAANVYPRVKLVNTVHRIALYGQRPIKPGEELFFDYGPQFPEKSLKGEEKAGKDPVAASAPHVRNKNLVSNFYDVEDTEDAAGNVVARKATSGRRAKSRAPKAETATPKSKPQGGARPVAVRKVAMADVAASDTLVAPPPPVPGIDNEEMLDARASPGHRLSAYYTSDDKIVDAAAGADAKDDEDFDPDASDDEAGEAQSTSGSSDESEAEGETPARKRRGRPKKYTR